MSLSNRISQVLRQHALHIRNVVYFLGTRAFAIVAFILVVPFFIRHASEQQYGLAAIGFSLLGIATVLDVAFGYVLIQSQGRRFARGRVLAADSIHGLFGFYLLLACATAAGGILLVLALRLPSAEALLYACLAALLPALSISGVVAAVFQAQNQLKPINLSRFGFELAKALALALSAVLARDIRLIGPVLLIAAYGRAVLDMRYLACKTGIKLRFPGFSLIRRYWRLARHGIASLYIVALTALVTIGDKILIKHFFSTDAVAHYSVAYDINTKAYLLVNAVNTAMFAVALHRFAKKNSTFAPLAAGLVTVSIVAILYYLPLFALAPVVLNYWVSADFAAGTVQFTRIMVFASLMYLYGNVFENALTAMGRARQVLRVYVVGIVAYGIGVGLTIWQQAIVGFMYSYLALCSMLCLGFIWQYRLAVRPAILSGVRHGCA
ncbi:lipopolysaccharide biosynthesis protein [Chromobacterium aquaticum]|uniref:Lipopolysaccharide biosynthesis protein n=1 Tax=Chromobacterium aquaticum TaxID=467180 RepID=A0ABV8ZM97_9NEIS